MTTITDKELEALDSLLTHVKDTAIETGKGDYFVPGKGWAGDQVQALANRLKEAAIMSPPGVPVRYCSIKYIGLDFLLVKDFCDAVLHSGGDIITIYAAARPTAVIWFISSESENSLLKSALPAMRATAERYSRGETARVKLENEVEQEMKQIEEMIR